MNRGKDDAVGFSLGQGAPDNERSKKHKHMTLEDRAEIQECLQKGLAFKAISIIIEA